MVLGQNVPGQNVQVKMSRSECPWSECPGQNVPGQNVPGQKVPVFLPGLILIMIRVRIKVLECHSTVKNLRKAKLSDGKIK